MNIDDIKLMIKRSLKTQLTLASEKARRMPENYSAFQLRVADTLFQLGVPEPAVNKIENCHTQNDMLFQSLWEGWQSFVLDFETDKGKNCLELAEFYLEEPLVECLCESGIDYETSQYFVKSALKKLIKN